MANIAPDVIGLTREWELISTAIGSATTSDVATGGIHTKIGTIYVITSGTVDMTIQIQESPDNTNWVTIIEDDIVGNESYRLTHPFYFMRINVSSYTGGQIDSIKIIGITQ
jgi:glutamate 5-kinase